MKIRNIICISILTFVASSCSLIQSLSQPTSKQSASEEKQDAVDETKHTDLVADVAQEQTNNSQQNSKVTHTVETSSNEAKVKSSAPIKPQDAFKKKKTKKDKKNKQKQKSSAKPQKSISPAKHLSDIDGEWSIMSVGSLKIEGLDEQPYVYFEADKNRVYIYNGCGYLNTCCELSNSGVLSFSDLVATTKYCEDVSFYTEIDRLFIDGSTLQTDLKKSEQESYLYLKDLNGKTQLVLHRNAMDFLNGNWQIKILAGNRIDDEEVNIFIDLKALKIHGNTGCNFFNGVMYVDPLKKNAVDFSNINSQRTACDKSDREAAIMLALERTVSVVKAGSQNQIDLLDAKGVQLMQLKRLQIKDEED